MENDQETTGWSFTKSMLFKSCPRAFYFSKTRQYPEKDEIDSPSEATASVTSLVGIAVHQSVAAEVAEWAAGRRTDIRRAQADATGWLNLVWENAGQRITEAANGQQLDPNSLERLLSSARARIKTFFMAVWPAFNGHKYLLHERLATFYIAGRPVHVKVDLCTKNRGGDIVITDWKTGHLPVLEPNSLQLSAYALWASQEFSVPPENIVIQLANLKTGEISSRHPSQKNISDARSQILGECGKWDRTDQAAFPTLPEFQKCTGCRYLQVCEPGTATVAQSVTGSL